VTEADGKSSRLLVTFEWSDWRMAGFGMRVYVLPTTEAAVSGCMTLLLADDRGNVCGFRLYVERENETARRVYDKAACTSLITECTRKVKAIHKRNRHL
jgi:hypothetical protein